MFQKLQNMKEGTDSTDSSNSTNETEKFEQEEDCSNFGPLFEGNFLINPAYQKKKLEYVNHHLGNLSQVMSSKIKSHYPHILKKAPKEVFPSLNP